MTFKNHSVRKYRSVILITLRQIINTIPPNINLILLQSLPLHPPQSFNRKTRRIQLFNLFFAVDVIRQHSVVVGLVIEDGVVICLDLLCAVFDGVDDAGQVADHPSRHAFWIKGELQIFPMIGGVNLVVAVVGGKYKKSVWF